MNRRSGMNAVSGFFIALKRTMENDADIAGRTIFFNECLD